MYLFTLIYYFVQQLVLIILLDYNYCFFDSEFLLRNIIFLINIYLIEHIQYIIRILELKQ